MVDRLRVRHALLAILGWSYSAFAYSQPIPPPGRSSGLVAVLTICPFFQLTGFPCPLCGLTRSWHSALHGDLTASFAFHELGPVLLPIWIVATIAFSVVAYSPSSAGQASLALVARGDPCAMLPNERCTRQPALWRAVARFARTRNLF